MRRTRRLSVPIGTATAATHATFEAENAAAIARHGAAEPTQTPLVTHTATSTRPSAAPPTPTSTSAPPTATLTGTAEPCAGQFSWQPIVVDDQGDIEAEYDEGSGKWDVLWQADDGSQMWAPLDYFCPDSADTPTPTDEAMATPTATPVVVVVHDTPAPARSAPAPRPAPPPPAAPQVTERVVTATPADDDRLDIPEPTSTSTPSPTSTATLTRTATPTSPPSTIDTPWPTATSLALATANDSERRGLELELPPWLDPLGRIVGIGLLVLLVLMLQAPVRRGWRSLRHGRGAGDGAPGGLADDTDVGLIGGGNL